MPKFRKKKLCGKIKQFLKTRFHELASQKESKILSGHIASDHVHMLISIPPKYAVSTIVGYLKGKSAISIARQFAGKKRNFSGECFWARGYYVSTVGFEEKEIRNYISNQEILDKQEEEIGNF